MSKIFKAQCVGQTVKVGGEIVVEAEILSNGIGESEGLAIVSRGDVFYLTTQTKDIEDLIESLEGVVDAIVAALNVINGGLTTPGAATASIALVETAKLQLNLIKETLR